MSALTSDMLINPQDLFTSSSVQQAVLGARAVTTDGRAVRYAKMGAVAGVVGKLYQAPAEVTANQDLAVSATAVGSTTITTTTTVTVTANQYAGGFVHVTVTPGVGYSYRIKSHPAATAAALTLTLEDKVQVALTTSSRIDLQASQFNGVIVNPTTATSGPVGACIYPIAAGEFGWLQVRGSCNLLNDGGSTVGTNVSASNGTAGAVEAAVTAQAAVGFAMSGIATTEYGPIYLTIG